MESPAWTQILADLADLRQQLAEVRQENQLLRAENQALRAENARLTQQLAKANERISELEAIVARSKQKPRRTPPPKPASAPKVDPEVDPDQEQAFHARPLPPTPEISEAKPPGKPPPTGRKPLPRHLPEDRTEVCPAQCGHCGGTHVDRVETMVEEKLHVVKEHQRRRVVKRTTVRCRNCLRRTTGESLPAPYERAKVTCDWLAWFLVQKFYLLVPLDRIRRLLGLQGVS